MPAKKKPVCGSPIREVMFPALRKEHFKNACRLNLVIDLDATFVSTRTDMASYGRAMKEIRMIEDDEVREDVLSRVFLFSLDHHKMWTILRPSSKEFIEFAACYFNSVSIWSAGTKDYVDEIASFLFPPHISRPDVIFNYDHCHKELPREIIVASADAADGSGPTAASPSHDTVDVFTKPLRALVKSRRAAMTNTIILDDRSDIAKDNIANLVQIPPFDPALTRTALAEYDTALDEFTEWLMTPAVMTAKDIRQVKKDACSIFSGKVYG